MSIFGHIFIKYFLVNLKQFLFYLPLRIIVAKEYYFNKCLHEDNAYCLQTESAVRSACVSDLITPVVSFP